MLRSQIIRRIFQGVATPRRLKSGPEIVDSELGKLHLTIEEDDSDKEGKFSPKEFVGREVQEDLSPYGTSLRTNDGRMERSLNSVTLIGRVGNDPLMRGSQEKPVTVFSLATNTAWKSQNEDWSHRTDWHNIAVFKKGLRDQAYNLVHKGQRLHIQGRIMYGEVVDAAGIRRHTTTIAADDIIYLSSKEK